MNLRFITISIFTLIAISTFGQSTTHQLLKNKTWAIQGMTDKTFEEEYTDSTIKSYFNGEPMGTSQYYLTNTLEKNFDSGKVGKVKEGKYIVTNHNGQISQYEIVVLTDSLLHIRALHNPTVIVKFKKKP